MKAFTNKELSELLPTAVLILAGATVIGAIDCTYNWGQYRDVGLSLVICLIAAYPIALLGGANALGRESSDNLTFLASLPVRRWTLWAVKLATNLGAAIVAAGVSFFICLVLVRMDGYSDQQLHKLFGDEGLGVLVALWFGTYGLAFFWSTMVRKPFAAVGLAVATAVALTVGLGYVLFGYLPNRWGPWLGFNPNGLEGPDASLFFAIVVSVAAVAAFAASGAAFVRSPMLEAKRRALRGLAWMLGIIVAAIVVSVAVWWIAAVPSPAAADQAYLEHDGRHVVLSTYDPLPGLWLADITAGGQPRLVVRSGYWTGPDSYRWPEAPLTFTGQAGWVVNLQTGKLWQPRKWPGAGSPSGRVFCYESYHKHGHDLVVKDAEGREIATLQGFSPVYQHAFSPDGRYLYAEKTEERKDPRPAHPPVQTDTLARLDTETGQVTTLSRDWPVAPFPTPLVFFPSARYLARDGWRYEHGGRTGTPYVSILDVPTGKAHEVDWAQLAGPGSAVDDRYLWGRSRPWQWSMPESGSSALEIIDTRTMKIVRTIGLREFRSAAGSAMTPKEAQGPFMFNLQQRRDAGPVYFTSRRPPWPVSSPMRKLHRLLIWSANPDGTGLRFLRATEGELLGIAATGELVIWEYTPREDDIYRRNASNKIILLDPHTRREKVVLSAP